MMNVQKSSMPAHQSCQFFVSVPLYPTIPYQLPWHILTKSSFLSISKSFSPWDHFMFVSQASWEAACQSNFLAGSGAMEKPGGIMQIVVRRLGRLSMMRRMVPPLYFLRTCPAWQPRPDERKYSTQILERDRGGKESKCNAASRRSYCKCPGLGINLTLSSQGLAALYLSISDSYVHRLMNMVLYSVPTGELSWCGLPAPKLASSMESPYGQISMWNLKAERAKIEGSETLTMGLMGWLFHDVFQLMWREHGLYICRNVRSFFVSIAVILLEDMVIYASFRNLISSSHGPLN